MNRELSRVVIAPDGKIVILDLWAELRGQNSGDSLLNSEACRASELSKLSPEFQIPVTRVGLHLGEEPFLAPQRGAATVYFTHCNLRCRDCSHPPKSTDEMSVEELEARLCRLVREGADSVNFVSPTLYWRELLSVFETLKTEFPRTPLIYNCGGYESLAAVEAVAPFIDIFLPDLKAVTPEGLAERRLPSAYAKQTMNVIQKMAKLRKLTWAGNQLMTGVVIRHLLVPGREKELADVLDQLEPLRKEVLVNVMTQYYVPAERRIVAASPDLHLTRLRTNFQAYVDGRPLRGEG